MKIKNEKDNVIVSGNLKKTELSIKTDDSKMFYILSNLYSDPVGAVVREYSTNCIDGHKMNNNQDPFHIILPGTFDSGHFIIFRDFGPGMSDDIIQNVFTTFGESTKIDSNDFTGCLGLGSKSALSITDSFTITSIVDGKKSIYSISKNSEKKPELFHFGTSDTNEKSGISINVPLNNVQFKSIERHIKDQLNFFKKKPLIFYGLDEEEFFDWKDDKIGNDEDIILKYSANQSRNSRRNENNNIIIQGEVGYVLNFDLLVKSLIITEDVEEDTINDELYVTKKTIDKLNIYNESSFNLFAKMGNVSFAPSREELIYDNSTIIYIIRLLLKKYTEVEEEVRLLTNNSLCDFDKSMIESYHRYGNSKLQTYLDKRYNSKSGELYQESIFFLSILRLNLKQDKKYISSIMIGNHSSYYIQKFEELSTTILSVKVISYSKYDISSQNINYLQHNNEEDKIKTKKLDATKLRNALFENRENVSNYKVIFIDEIEKNYLKTIKSYKIESAKIIVFRTHSNIQIDNNSSYVNKVLDILGMDKTFLLNYQDVLEEIEFDKEYIKKEKKEKFAITYKVVEMDNAVYNSQTMIKHDEIPDDIIGLYVHTKNLKYFPEFGINLKNDDIIGHYFNNKMNEVEQSEQLNLLFKMLNATKENNGKFLNNLIPKGIKIYIGNKKLFKKTRMVSFETFMVKYFEKIRKLPNSFKTTLPHLEIDHSFKLMFSIIDFLKSDDFKHPHVKNLEDIFYNKKHNKLLDAYVYYKSFNNKTDDNGNEDYDYKKFYERRDWLLDSTGMKHLLGFSTNFENLRIGDNNSNFYVSDFYRYNHLGDLYYRIKNFKNLKDLDYIYRDSSDEYISEKFQIKKKDHYKKKREKLNDIYNEFDFIIQNINKKDMLNEYRDKIDYQNFHKTLSKIDIIIDELKYLESNTEEVDIYNVILIQNNIIKLK